MDFWARGAFHRGRRLAKADAAPNVVRKAVRKNLGRNNGSEYNDLTGDLDEYIQIPAVSIGPRRRT
jgi:hypothetical protein